jgi:hypothetical protein
MGSFAIDLQSRIASTRIPPWALARIVHPQHDVMLGFGSTAMYGCEDIPDCGGALSTDDPQRTAPRVLPAVRSDTTVLSIRERSRCGSLHCAGHSL